MKIKFMKLSDIGVAKPFAALFPIGDDPLESIKIDMQTNGFDEAFPIIVWEEKNIVVDGHTRYNVARELEIEEVPVLFRSFESEDDAILYAFHLQRNRRNLADEDILRCLHLLDKIRKPAASAKDKPEITKKESAELRAKELGTSKTKIEKARKVLEHASEELKDAVGAGEKTINKAFNEMQEMRRESGELKGRVTSSLGCSARYNKALGKYLHELRLIKEEGWEQISREKALLDLETIEALIG